MSLVADGGRDEGEPSGPLVEVKIDDRPTHTSLLAMMSRGEDLRLEAYRRLASVTPSPRSTTSCSEWSIALGPRRGAPGRGPAPVECLRTGVREVSATPARAGEGTGAGSLLGFVARIAPLELPASARVRLRRSRAESLVKEDTVPLVSPSSRRATRRGPHGTPHRARPPACSAGSNRRAPGAPSARSVKRLLALVVVGVLCAAVAGCDLSPDAATVNGSTISQSEFQGQLSVVSHSTEAQCALSIEEAQSGGMLRRCRERRVHRVHPASPPSL